MNGFTHFFTQYSILKTVLLLYHLKKIEQVFSSSMTQSSILYALFQFLCPYCTMDSTKLKSRMLCWKHYKLDTGKTDCSLYLCIYGTECTVHIRACVPTFY